ncbi:hypothetical protein SAMN02910453_0587 [Lachnospiraceae bacterium A10]|nr:hypothetical protein SAMN02910453_0587 [Lachnospiraceae bacterium A10]
MSNDFIRAERPEKRRRRRHRYSESVKPASQASYIAAIVSGVSILYTLFIMVYSVVEAGEIGNVFGGVAFLFMLASIVSLYVGGREFRDKSRSQISRLVGLCVPVASVLIWIAIYGIGLVVN